MSEHRYIMVQVDGVAGIRDRSGGVTLASGEEFEEPAYGTLEHLWLVLRILSATVAQVDDEGATKAPSDG